MYPKHTDLAGLLPAATVILVRQHRTEFQVYLLKRHAQSGFMAGYYVFPGGILDPGDWRYDVWKTHVDLDGPGLTRRLGGDLTPEEVMAYGVAAIRELLEEAGIFLAKRLSQRPPAQRVARILPPKAVKDRGAKRPNRCGFGKPNQSNQDLSRIIRLRNSPDLPEEWLLDLVMAQSWTLTFSALFRWSHWITPVRMKRRYDTRFFLAFLPRGQRCTPHQREVTDGIWISPQAALAGNMTGQIPLSPPTMVTLQEVSKYPTLKELKQQAQSRAWRTPSMPRLILLEKGSVLIEPWDAQYDQPHIEIVAENLKDAVLPAGEPFSRIWHDGRLYLPIKA
jgi:8-oxo-dGTP pyrophosphatase MutT (NUDIX family)